MQINATGFVWLFNRWGILGLFVLLGLFTGIALISGYRRPQRLSTKESIPEWAKPVTPISTQTLAITTFCFAAIIGGTSGWFAGPIIGIGLGLASAIFIPLMLINRLQQQWIDSIEDETMSMIQLLILKLQSGQSLIPSLEDIATSSLHGPLKKEIMEYLVGNVIGGGSVTGVLARLRDSDRYKKTWRYQRVLRHLTTAARAQMPAAKLADRMSVLQSAMVDTYSLQLELESEVVQAKYSRWIVSGTLPITVVAFNMFAPEIAVNLFKTLPGQITLVVVTVMVFLLHFVGGKIAQLPPLEL